MHTPDPHGAGYEKRDAQIRPLAESGALLVVLCLGAFGSMIWLFNFLQSYEQKARTPNGNALTSAREIPPEPRLETAPHMPVNWAETNQLDKKFFKDTGLADVRAQENADLNSYGWVDPTTKLVHIPIQQAMQKLLEQGLPVRK
jgi:hypothetical protein